MLDLATSAFVYPFLQLHYLQNDINVDKSKHVGHKVLRRPPPQTKPCKKVYPPAVTRGCFAATYRIRFVRLGFLALDLWLAALLLLAFHSCAGGKRTFLHDGLTLLRVGISLLLYNMAVCGWVWKGM